MIYILGYGGDVWYPQPAPKDHPWRYMPNQAMTPHISGTTIDGQVNHLFSLITEYNNAGQLLLFSLFLISHGTILVAIFYHQNNFGAFKKTLKFKIILVQKINLHQAQGLGSHTVQNKT